jgi:uncharacterized protein YfaT (DUF1175 family)
MVSKKNNARKFSGLSYREVQRSNSSNRETLKREDRKWLKENGYRNSGWNDVIRLYEKIKDFLDRYKLDELTLEDLFIEADRIGNKYQTRQEIEEFHQKLSQEIEEISVEIDNQFPDTESEVIDFSGNMANHIKL